MSNLKNVDEASMEPIVHASIRERPILFSGPMVRAIIDGKKTQTRRIVKPQPEIGIPDEFIGWTAWNESVSTHDTRDPDAGVVDEWICRYGFKGQRLWVKETWYVGKPMDHKPPSQFKKKVRTIKYLADGPKPNDFGRSRSPLHMPRWASRITLEVTGIRVERLNGISPEDAISEGIGDWANEHNLNGYWTTAFARLWESINGKGSCAVNPWVWVVQFRRV